MKILPPVTAGVLLGLGILLGFTAYRFQNVFPGLPEVVVAFGTIVLAVATFELGRTTVRENKKQLEKSERMRREERRIGASLRIRQWAEETLRILVLTDVDQKALASDLTRVSFSFGIILAGSVGARNDAVRVGSDMTGAVTVALTAILDFRDSVVALDFTKRDMQLQDCLSKLQEVIRLAG